MSMTGGRSPRDQGNRAERLVAKYIDGERVVGSGAYKFSNKNLLGDVDVWISARPYLKLEVKTTGRTGKAGPVYAVPFKVLQQMKEEAEQYRELGCVWVHYKNNRTHNDLVVFPLDHWIKFVNAAHMESVFSDTTLTGKKSLSLSLNSVLSVLPSGGQHTIGVVQCSLDVDGVVHSYVVVTGSDVQYALTKIRESNL